MEESKGKLEKKNKDNYFLSCAFCPSTTDIEMYPFRLKEKVVGDVFVCVKCKEKAEGCQVEIHE